MNFESLGYIKISGNSEYTIYNNSSFEGRAYLRISSDYSFSFSSIHNSDLNLELISDSEFKYSVNYIGSGSLGSFGNSSNIITPYISRGGISISSTKARVYNSSFNFDLDSRFIAYGTGDPDFDISFDSRWNVNTNNYYWYRILACSRDPSEENNENPIYSDQIIDGKFEDPKCGIGRTAMLTAVAARNIDDVCSVLKSPKLGPPVDFKIISIKKYIDPITGQGVRSLLVEEEFCNSSSCLEFCLDFDFSKENIFKIPFRMSVVSNIFYYESYLNLRLQGSSDVIYLEHTGNGGIQLTGSGELVSPVFVINSDLILDISSEIEFYINPYLINFEGSIDVFGSLSDFVSPKYIHNSIANLSLSSTSEIKRIFNYNSYLNLNIESNVELFTDQNFIYEPSGFIILDGNLSLIELAYFEYDSKGSLVFGGNVEEILSSSWKYEASGSLEIIRNTSKIGRCFDASGSMNLTGSAEVYNNFSFNSFGGIDLSGYSNLVFAKRSFISTGESVDFEGLADVNFTNLGLFVANLNLYSSYSNLEIDYNSNNLSQQNNLTINTGTVNVCGCISALNLNLLHNIQFAGSFSNFLKRNPLVNYDNNFILRYNSNRSSWSNSVSYAGNSQNNEPVIWQFISDLSCTNILENQSFDDFYLKFNFLVKRQESNKTLISNFIVNINSDQICQNNQPVSTTILYNNVENLVFIDDIPTDFYKIKDDIGLFSNDYWGNKLDFSPLRRRYCSSNSTETQNSASPLVVGTFPSFKINIDNAVNNIDQAIADGCAITIENPDQIIL